MIGEGLLKWRAKQRKGAIMSPKTFGSIAREAEKRGYRNPQAVAGAAYWSAVKAKYKARK